MHFRSFLFFVIGLTFFSCDFVQKKMRPDLKKEYSDTIVDLSKVDVLPVFSVCDSILEIDEKNRCFKNNLYKHLSESLLKHTFQLSDSVNERVLIKLMIDKKGVSKLISIESSEFVKAQLPILDSLIQQSIQSIPQFPIPALKNSIRVSTVYEVPIVIKL